MNLFPPKKKHLDIIANLVKLGCNESDICLVLNIPDATLNIWKTRSKTLVDLLKPKARPEFTLNHPDFAPMVEEAFVCGGKRFFRFKEEYRMATGRYRYYWAGIRQVEMRVNLETLESYIEAFEAVLNGGGKKKSINLGALWELIHNLKSRVKLGFDPQTVREFAAVAYFDESEDITTFNERYGQEKIKLWKDHNFHDFFLTKPIAELLNANSLSITSFLEHLKEMDGVTMEQGLSLQRVLEENS